MKKEELKGYSLESLNSFLEERMKVIESGVEKVMNGGELTEKESELGSIASEESLLIFEELMTR